VSKVKSTKPFAPSAPRDVEARVADRKRQLIDELIEHKKSSRVGASYAIGQLKSRLSDTTKVVKVDDHTVDFVLASPNPLLMQEWETRLIMSKSWSEANGATKVQPATRSLGPAALKTNGTGPFMLVSHEPGVKTVLRRNPSWWGKADHNLDEVIIQPIKSDSTRLAALQSGEIDMVDPVPLQDVERLPASGCATVLAGPELRTIFLNMDSFRDELLYSNVKGKNPFKDPRVRKAFYQAIDIDAIDAKIMRGMAEPTPLMIAPMAVLPLGRIQTPSLRRGCRAPPHEGGGLRRRFRADDGLPQRPLRQ